MSNAPVPHLEALGSIAPGLLYPHQADGATTTKTGLKVLCELDENKYQKGIVVSDAEMAGLNITRAEFHGEWNYTIAPSNKSCEAVVS